MQKVKINLANCFGVGRYHTKHAEVVWFDNLPKVEKERYFPKEYEVLVAQEPADLSGQLVAWVKALERKTLKSFFNDAFPYVLVAFFSDEHIYYPLRHVPVKRQVLKASTLPVSLNDGQKRLVSNLGANSYRSGVPSPGSITPSRLYMSLFSVRLGMCGACLFTSLLALCTPTQA